MGDLTYSDSYHTNGILRHPDPPTTPYQETYQPRWDAWGRLMAPLASQASQAKLSCQLGGPPTSAAVAWRSDPVSSVLLLPVHAARSAHGRALISLDKHCLCCCRSP